MPCTILRVCPFILVILLVGCAGRSQFYRAEALVREDHYREAYYHYWEAYRLNPREDYRQALRTTGKRVAEDVRRKGQEAERQLEYRLALEAYALGLEYDPGSAQLSEDHARVRGILNEWDRLADELKGRREHPSSGWGEVDVLLRMSGHPMFTGVQVRELETALSSTVEMEARPLRRATFQATLPSDPDSLDDLLRGWTRLEEECARRILEEEASLFAFGHAGGEVAHLGLVRSALSPGLEESRGAVQVISRALAGCRELDRAATLEVDLDLVGAVTTYSRAALLHPDLEEARAGRARTLRLVTLQNHRAATLAVKRREWPEALRRLEDLLRLVPGHEEARELRAMARRELAAQHAREARRFEESGLQGNALVYYLKAQELSPAEELARALSRNESAMQARLQPDVSVKIRAVSSEERRAVMALWKIEEEVLARAEQDLLRAAQARVDALLAVRYGAGRRPLGGGHTLALFVEDLEFIRLRGNPSTGREKVRFVESVSRVPNPEYRIAVQRRDAAHAEYQQVLARIESLPPRMQASARAREPFLRFDWEQLEALVHSLPAEIPKVQWGSSAFSRVTTTVHLELSARYSFAGAEHWASAVLEAEEQVVDGDPARRIVPDPDESTSPSGALRMLAPRLGAALGDEVERLLTARHERYFRDALEHIERSSFDLAVEELVAFILARGRTDDPQVRLAARTLEQIAGCDLLSRSR